jgi:hypothetical protein
MASLFRQILTSALLAFPSLASADTPRPASIPAGGFILIGGRQPATGDSLAKIEKSFSLAAGLYLLSGGPDPHEPLNIDDDLELSVGGRKIFIDNDHVRTTEGRGRIGCTYAGEPILLPFARKAKLRIQVIDTGATDAVVGDLYLHRWDGAKVQLVKAIHQRSAPKLPNVFFDKEFAIDELFPAAEPLFPAEKLTEQQLQSAWNDLASTKPANVFFAVWRLAACPEQSVPWIRAKVSPAKQPDPQRLLQLLSELGDRSFRIREKATRELEEKDKAAKPSIRSALERQPSAEARLRMGRLLERLRAAAFPPETMRRLRAVEVLEYAGTPQARRLLSDIARGAPESVLTKDASAARERMGN